ncbi:translocase [Corynebacterium phocae]|uniref:Translocase n=1 Tax=Corynebacterium phocae TaxID=161895 RepID=A0A1L7D3T6_9CORY|nr:Sec-independent protein translocase TatB [Corynebacterium phocae]APT92809.1 translocase [Corynebacterium phocae]KAA8723124.1 Sec-independent protein translocase TatB [Corynebacterium phocae]
MFSSIGWGEIFVIVILGVIIVGPERLPGVIEDVRAAIFAARKAINNAKAELNGEIGEVSQEFESLRGPISTAAQWSKMGPRAALTKALFDGDDSAWDDFDPRKPAPQQAPAQPPAQPPANEPQAGGGFDYSQIYAQPESPVTAEPRNHPGPGVARPLKQGGFHSDAKQERDTGGEDGQPSFSWADVT